MSIPKTALVTGAARRVGRAIAEGLADSGFAVAVHHNTSPQDADDLVSALQKRGAKACAVKADLSDDNQTRSLVSAAAEQLGTIGLLVNNASLFEDDAPDTLDDALWQKHFQVHVKAPSLLAAEFSRQIGENEGLIVNMIDQRVHKLTPNFYSYTLSKSALWTATRTLAQALAPNIRVNAIGPGPTLPSHRQTQEIFDTQVQTLLLKRAPELEEFVRTILFFVQTPSVTGQMIALDGGQHLTWDTADQRVPE